MKKKNKSLLLITFLFIASFQSFLIYNGESSNEKIFTTPELFPSADPSKEPFFVGVMAGPSVLDPHDAWDHQSYNVINQVCEGLYTYDLNDPNLAIIPNLANSDGTWSLDGLEYTIYLITNATFHDGTEFNATAVQWSFNRLQYFMNHTGQLPISTSISIFHSMYEFEDGSPIINRTEVINDFTIKLVLNRPFVALPSLLCNPGSYILSPSSTSATNYLDTNTDDLVGTGPFVYDGYIPGINISFHSYEDYWKGKADFDEMYFQIIDDTTARHDALLDGTVHFIPNLWTDYLDSFNANPNITVLDYGKTKAIIYYLGMNNKQINQTFRQAISYAINYSYIIDDFYEGNVVRAKSPIPQGILYSNWTNDYATFNITKAREIMQSMGFGVGLDTAFPGPDEALWSSASFAAFKYTYNADNQFRVDFGWLLYNCLDLIGIDVIDDGVDLITFIERILGISPGGYDDLELFWIGWGADYNDPVNFINTLFSNTSISNAAQVNDPYLQNLIDQGYEETDPILRKQIYDEIQRYLVEDLMPWAWGYCPKLFDAHHIDLSGYQQNAMQKVYFYPCQWDRLVYETQVSEPDDITYTEGSTGNILNWTITADKVLNPMYYVYNSSGLVYSDTWSSGVPVIVNVDGLPFGTNTYWIEVHNENVILSDYIEVFVLKKRSPITFLVGTTALLSVLDPHNAWDTMSYNVIDQVCEGLYMLDLNDPNLAPIPNLASSDGTWSLDGLEHTISLITNATFHDGTKFNATAVQWTFNRLQYFMNHTGQLPISTSISIFHSMYEFDDGSPIINRTEIINDFTIKIVLNKPFAALPSLLCNPGSYILSPTSTSATNYLDKTTDDLVGTGPFVYDGAVLQKEVYFHAYDDYWKGKADIDEMYFAIYEDYSELRDALLDGTIHFIINPLYNDIDAFNANPTLTVLDTGTTKGLIYYLCMNNKQINQTFRQAISYAINYSYIIDDLYEGNVVRAGSPIPQGLLYSNWTNNYATFDIQQARQVMQSMGYGYTGATPWDTTYPGTDETLWSGASFAAFKYTYNADNQFRVDFGWLLYNCLDLIGIDVIDDGVDVLTFIERILGISPGGFDDLELFWIGWIADYNDPVNFINTFFSNTSFSNAAQVNDPYLQNLIDQGYEETDPILRKQIYDEIQRYLVEDLMPWAWGYCPKLYTAYHIDLSGYKQNAMQKLDFYPCQWDRQYPGSFNLYTDADPIDDDGNFDLNWDLSEDATNYTVYEHSSYITVINGSLTPLLVETTDLTLSRSGYSDGTYFFIITANNDYGYTESNCIEVYVRFPQPPGPFNLFTDADPIDDDGNFDLNWDISEDATNYTVYEHSSYITVINGSLTPLLVETTDLTLSLSEYTSGTYYFIVVAYNDYGQTMSNCIKVVVQIPQPSPPIPGYSIYILICAISIASIILVKKLNLKMPKEL